MKTLLLNLPFKKRVMRRFVASYFAPNFLMPPLELMSLGAILKQWKKAQVVLLDAIAEEKNLAQVIEFIKKENPKLLVTMTGFNTLPQEIASLKQIKQTFPTIKIIVFGYLPSQFPKETLQSGAADFILYNEPEESFSQVYDALKQNQSLHTIKGVAFNNQGQAILNPPAPRLQKLDKYPFADYELIDLQLYNESYLGRPIGTILSARGCPYRCNFCVRMYGDQWIERSPENILCELRELKDKGISNIRFLDDTFTVNKKRLHKICQGMLEQNLNLNWTCLTRLDCVDEAVLGTMKKSGCKRIYAAIESGSQRMLDYYQKGLNIATVEKQVKLIQRHNIELSAFFIVGAPTETEEDIHASIDLATKLKLDFIIATKLQYWPGTSLYEMEKGKVDFDLISNENTLYTYEEQDRATYLQKLFYRKFYLRPSYILQRCLDLFTVPKDLLGGFIKLLYFVSSKKQKDDFI